MSSHLVYTKPFAAYQYREYPKWVQNSEGRSVLVNNEEEEAEVAVPPPSPPPFLGSEPADGQILKLAQFLSDKYPEELSDDETAIQCAIRLLTEDETGEDSSAADAPRRRGRPPKKAE